MVDVFTKKKRSEVMSQIRGRGNRGTELRMIELLREHGITGWRRNRPVFGRPDFVFPAERVALFIDGCFWHGCPRHYNRPSSNTEFWDGKLLKNRTRDRLVTRTLKKAGWTVLRVWEHALQGTGKAVVARVRKVLAH